MNRLNSEGCGTPGVRRWLVLTLSFILVLAGAARPIPGRTALAAAGPGIAATQGSVWSWGANYYGQVGDGLTDNRLVPYHLASPTGITALAAGTDHVMALAADGTLWAWGLNDEGQLGDNSTTERDSPVHLTSPTNLLVNTPGTNRSVALGFKHSLALAADGTIWAWGDNAYGQVGDGTTDDRHAPVHLTAPTNIVSVAAGHDHNLALASDGTVWAWGRNGAGQVGDGTNDDRLTPYHLVNFASPAHIVAIAAGMGHSLALASDGTIWAWGTNNTGQLGIGSSTGQNLPYHLNPFASPATIVAIAAGANHSLALASDGTVWAWGENIAGQIGDGTDNGYDSPHHLTSLTGIAAIAAGDWHSLALTNAGAVWLWGSNYAGEMGDGLIVERRVPYHLNGLTGVIDIAGGAYHTHALQGALAPVTLTVTTGGQGTGTVTVDPAGTSTGPTTRQYPGGTLVTLTAEAGSGQVFTGWKVDGNLTGWANPLRLPMGADHTVTAIFEAPKAFCDVNPNDPYFDAIQQLSARGIIRGYTDADNRLCVGPNDNTLREHMAALIVRAMPGWLDETWPDPFSDPTDDAELMQRVATLGHYQVAQGYQAEICQAQGKGVPCFGPLDQVKYGQTLLFIARGMVYHGYWQLQADDRTIFPDQNGDAGADPSSDRQTLDHRMLVTYIHYAGAPPDVADVHANFAVGGVTDGSWGVSAPRGWFSRADWQALNSYFNLNHTP